MVLLAGAAPLFAQEGGESELRGSVVSASTGEVVAGAWVALEDQEWGTFSWNDGHFSLPEIPSGPNAYEVKALGFESEVVTLDPADGDLVVRLVADPEMQERLSSLMGQLERRRGRGGDLRVFDREALSFNAYFSLRDFLAQHGVRPVRRACLNERPEAIGILDREGHQFYLVETFGDMVRLYTEDFIQRAAGERLELQREPSICSGPVNGD
jgi:hypothetical protein